MKLMAKLLGAACAGTALLFAVYYFNLDLKLIRTVRGVGYVLRE